MRDQKTQVVAAVVAAISQGGVLWAWSAQALPAEWVPIVQAGLALIAALVQAFLPAVELRRSGERIARTVKTGILIAAALAMTACSTRLAVKDGDREELIIRHESPSLIEYRLNGRVRFSRTGTKPLPVRCERAP